MYGKVRKKTNCYMILHMLFNMTYLVFLLNVEVALIIPIWITSSA